MPLLGEVEQAEEGRGDAEGFVSTEQNASQSVCKYNYRGDRGDHGDLDDHGVRGDQDDLGDHGDRGDLDDLDDRGDQ